MNFGLRSYGEVYFHKRDAPEWYLSNCNFSPLTPVVKFLQLHHLKSMSMATKVGYAYRTSIEIRDPPYSKGLEFVISPSPWLNPDCLNWLNRPDWKLISLYNNTLFHLSPNNIESVKMQRKIGGVATKIFHQTVKCINLVTLSKFDFDDPPPHFTHMKIGIPPQKGWWNLVIPPTITWAPPPCRS